MGEDLPWLKQVCQRNLKLRGIEVQVEADEDLSGEEKNARKQELMEKIEELAGKLGIE
jgi:hypothetical protein